MFPNFTVVIVPMVGKKEDKEHLRKICYVRETFNNSMEMHVFQDTALWAVQWRKQCHN